MLTIIEKHDDGTERQLMFSDKTEMAEALRALFGDAARNQHEINTKSINNTIRDLYRRRYQKGE